MIWEDVTYIAAATLLGGLARSVRRGLPSGWSLRLEAAPAEDLREGWIWVHAVSMGELILAEGILGWLRDQGHRIHITTGTPAGMELMAKRLPGWDKGTGQVSGGGFPFDDRQGLRSFLNPAPGAFIALETELWPNLIRNLTDRGIPRIIVNGRLTERSLRKGGPWMRAAARRLTVVAARDETSATSFRNLGAPQVVLGGNLKADLPPPAPLHDGWERLRQAWTNSQILVAGNTVEGEEELLLSTWSALRHDFPGLRLILAPRQPRRFQTVANLFQSKGLRFRRASEAWPGEVDPWLETDVLLLDTLGELPSAYREGTLALVGGGWNWDGGHNPLEPVRWGLPTLIGPGYRNFEDLALPLIEAGKVNVTASEDLHKTVHAILNQAPVRPTDRPVELPKALCGALERTCLILKDVLTSPR